MSQSENAQDTRPEADPQDWPSGKKLRDLTRLATNAHTGGNAGELISEVYSVLFSAVVAFVMVLGAVQGLNAEIQSGPENASIDPGWLGLVVALIVLGAVIGLAARLGPVGMGGAHALWWLTTPADRRTLLRPRLILIPIIAAGLGLAGGLLVAFLTFGSFGADLAWVTIDFILGSAALVLAVALGQIYGRTAKRARITILLGDTLTAGGPILALVLVLTQPEPVGVNWEMVGPIVAAISAICLVLFTIMLDRGFEKISGRELRERGAISTYASGAVTSMDTRELGRALTVATTRDARRRSASMSFARGPISAIFLGDLTVLLRSGRHMIQILVGLCVALLGIAAGWPVVVNVLLLLIGGYLCAMATAEGARRAEMAPVLDRHFPIAATDVRRARIVLPLVIMVPWTLIVFAVWGWIHGDLPGYLLLGLVTSPIFASGVIRAAYRKAPDWSKPLVPSPFGAMAPGVIRAFARGVDVVVICAVPMIVGVVAIGPTPLLVAIQAAAAFIAFSIATKAPKKDGKGFMERMQEQAEAQRKEMDAAKKKRR